MPPGDNSESPQQSFGKDYLQYPAETLAADAKTNLYQVGNFRQCV